MDINSETLELLERRLGENVEKRVRSRLFAIYGAAATAFLGAFGYFGYDILTTAKDAMGEIVTEFEQDAADKVREEVEPFVKGARDAAEKAEDIASSVSAQLDFLSERASERAARLSIMQEDVNRAVATMKLQLAALQSDIEEAQTQFENQRINSDDLYAGAGDLDNLAGKLGSDLGLLAEQVGLMKEQISKLRSASAEDTPDAAGASLDLIQQVAKTYKQQVVDPGRAREMPTVYFQFAGVKRELAKAISKKLTALDYTMPGEERRGWAAGKKEIRYFFEDDADQAGKLAEDLNLILENDGFQAEITVENYTVYKGAKPRPGTLELWLEPVRIK